MPLFGNDQPLETGMQPAGATQDVLLQAFDQRLLPGMFAQELGTGAQVLGQLAACKWCGPAQRALAQTDVPQTQADQQCQRQQRLRKVAQQQAQQVVVFGLQHQGHLAVLRQIPEQPGIVIVADRAGFPQVGVRDNRDQPSAPAYLQQVRGIGAVRPGLGVIFRVFEVKRRIETHVGRGALVFQVQAGQLRPGHLLVCGGRRHQRDGQWRLSVGQLLFLGIDVFGEVLMNLQTVQQQIAAATFLFVPQLFGDEQQVPACFGPVQQLLGLRRRHVFPVIEQQQGLGALTRVGKLGQRINGIHCDREATQKMFGRQPGIGLRLWRGALIDRFLVALELSAQKQRATCQQQQDQ
ncbi:hypothetical protein ALQ20_05450 [Pseudomonas syringae pv. atrofaciens]|nr:hypothetical protein ALQ20_05450 [Pseudomonas syringae pv. atrofaciens]